MQTVRRKSERNKGGKLLVPARCDRIDRHKRDRREPPLVLCQLATTTGFECDRHVYSPSLTHVLAEMPCPAAGSA